MFKQIIVAMAGAIAAQLTAATLSFTPPASNVPEPFEPRPAAVRLAIMPGTPNDIFAAPVLVSSVVPFLGAPQIASRQ